MNLTLLRTEKREDGIFGRLLDEDNNIVCFTLEHAYGSGDGDGSYEPKLPNGTYTCVRGPHRLHGMTKDFETFEVTNVPGHKGILFHTGNYNDDSEGCILVGTFVTYKDNTTEMLAASKIAFNKFLELQENVDSFILTVK